MDDSNDLVEGESGQPSPCLDRITREQLYELVWSEPGTHVAKRYGVSDVAVAKWCRNMDVPRPPPGYWARLQAGRKPWRAPLPPPQEGQPEVIYPERLPTAGHQPEEAPPPPPFLELFQDPIPVPDHLRHTHHLVRVTRTAFPSTKKRPDEVFSPDGDALALKVSKAQLNRALRIMDAILQQVQAAGWMVTTKVETPQWGPRRQHHYTTVRVGQVEVPLSLRELSTTGTRREVQVWDGSFGETPHRWVGQVSYPKGTGRLWLRAGNLHEHWSPRPGVGDGRRNTLEQRLFRFVEKFLLEAERLRLKKIEDDECRRREEEERRRREEAERRRQEELRRRHHLKRLAKRWRRNQELRTFLQAAEELLLAVGQEPEPRHAEWLAWARGYVDQLDPLKADAARDLLTLAPPVGGFEEDDDGSSR